MIETDSGPPPLALISSTILETTSLMVIVFLISTITTFCPLSRGAAWCLPGARSSKTLTIIPSLPWLFLLEYFRMQLLIAERVHLAVLTCSPAEKSRLSRWVACAECIQSMCVSFYIKVDHLCVARCLRFDNLWKSSCRLHIISTILVDSAMVCKSTFLTLCSNKRLQLSTTIAMRHSLCVLNR